MEKSNAQETSSIVNAITSELTTMVGGVTGILLGAWSLTDDLSDLGRFADETHPSPLHHWWLGVLAILGGIATTGAGGIRLFLKLKRMGVL